MVTIAEQTNPNGTS